MCVGIYLFTYNYSVIGVYAWYQRDQGSTISTHYYIQEVMSIY
jgi:hypothetical protein